MLIEAVLEKAGLVGSDAGFGVLRVRDALVWGWGSGSGAKRPA